MKSLNSILILSLIICLSVTVKTNTTFDLFDEQCIEQLSYFDNALSARESWALEFFDTWTNFQPRSKVDYGDFDVCVEFRHESKDAGLIQGKHCLVHYKELRLDIHRLNYIFLHFHSFSVPTLMFI